MRWPIFAVFALIGVTLETSLLGVFSLRSLGNVTPSVVACLVVFIALLAPRWTALWACWVLGLLMDLCAPPYQDTSGHVFQLIGLHAVGYVAGCFLILHLRTMMFRRRVVTISMLTFVCVIAVTAVAGVVYLVRPWYGQGLVDPAGVGALKALLRGVGVAVYSLLLAIPVGWLLVRTIPWWGFHATAHRSPALR